ncbi:MAG: tetratricopeptide repeat protein [Desulfobulbaceae bacterium]|nr:tetratricopeptide repeat protein [Desulfobulbaceae bacterium]
MDNQRKEKKSQEKEKISASGKNTPANRKKTELWKSLLTSLFAIVIFFGLLEGILALFGVTPVLQSEDPFVGFSSNIPLFVEETDAQGQKIMTTAKNKLDFFNMQQFPKKKEPGTYRVFCLGGSTTYGRPYNDKTSFAGWLRELLPAADPSHRWEVINAGGISYASYRVSHLMEELVRYEPDLFIIYSGHNEFLEKRTYGALRDIPAVVKVTATTLARTRTWSAMKTVLKSSGVLPEVKSGQRVQMTGEVSTILARSAGPERYKRDDSLRDNVLLHYRISLERMTDIARSVGANIIFVTPASNLKDCSPFKSQHTEGLSAVTQSQAEEMLARALGLIGQEAWFDALQVLNEAIAIDPRYAELHYRRGKALFALGRYDEAAEAFRQARDEDVCPLRALTPMGDIVAEVAAKENDTLVDYINLLKDRIGQENGYDIPGEEYFLDHVHPTLAGNKMLAVELVETMIDERVVQPSGNWGEKAIAEVSSLVEGRVDQQEHARALVNLARVLHWAGKFEDAKRLALQALKYQDVAPDVFVTGNMILGTINRIQGNTDDALQYYRKAMKKSPDSVEIHLAYGYTFLGEPFRNFEVGAAHILFANVFGPEDDNAYATFGLAMAERQRYPLAYSSLREALRINPQNEKVKSALARLRELSSSDLKNPDPPKFAVDKYPSGVPSKIVQMRLSEATGQYIPNGIWTEWYENGELKRFVDYVKGVPHGVEINWSPDGQVVSRIEYREGKETRPRE